ncbi:MAG: hypothetical protein R3325_13920 [Thermoanaerobaculia bacterium]|nr:hypothetical protein [Thermoanaerobaculia bacterium]
MSRADSSRPLWRLAAWTAAAVGALALAHCRENAVKLSLFLDDSGPSYAVRETFGQLVDDAPPRVAGYMTVQLSPAGTQVLAPTSGTIRYYDQLDGRTSCLLLRPKLRKKRDGTAFDDLEPTLPDPSELRLALCNLEAAALEAAIVALYEARGVDDAQDQADGFLDDTVAAEQRPELDVWAPPEALSGEADAPPWSELGTAEFDELEVAAFVEDDAGHRTYVNPAPYLARIPLAPSDSQLRPPTIAEIRVETAVDPAFTTSVEAFSFDPTTGAMNPAAELSGFLRVFFRLTNFNDDLDPAFTVAPYEISYELRETGGAPQPRSRGRFLLASLPAGPATTPQDAAESAAQALYRLPGADPPASDLALSELWLYLPLDPAEVVAEEELVTGNAGAAGSFPTSLDLDAEAGGLRLYPAGDYELEVTVANAFDPADTGVALAAFPILGPHEAHLTAANAAEAEEEVPGAAIRLNDDNDNANTWPDPSPDPANHLPLEPWLDLDETTVVAGEDDLMELTVDVVPHTLVGDATLTIPSGAHRIRLWNQADKGGAAIPAGDVVIPMADMPRTVWVEGLETGAAELHLEYDDGGTILEDTVNVHVVRLVDEQNGARRVINTYATDVDFEVEGGTAAFEYRWDLDGDGARANDVFEAGLNSQARSVRYDVAETAASVQLDQVAGNNRQTYDVSVELTGGLVLERTIRVALGTRLGTALPAQTNPGIQGAFAWSNTVPIDFDNVSPAEQTALAGMAGFTLDINLGNRIQHGPSETSYAVTHTSLVSDLDAMRIWVVGVGPALWDQGWHHQELDAVVAHEQIHLEQYEQVRADMAGAVDLHANTVYRRIFTNLVFAQGVTFLEAEAHLSELDDPDVEWGWHVIAPAATLQIFTDNYNQALGHLPGLPAADQALARTLLQDIYANLPFEEMKVPNYDFSVQPPP